MLQPPPAKPDSQGPQATVQPAARKQRSLDISDASEVLGRKISP